MKIEDISTEQLAKAFTSMPPEVDAADFSDGGEPFFLLNRSAIFKELTRRCTTDNQFVSPISPTKKTFAEICEAMEIALRKVNDQNK